MGGSYGSLFNSHATDQDGPSKLHKSSLEALEDRTLPTGGLPYPTPSTVSQLTADIVYANSNAGSYTITLAASTTFKFTSADNITNSAWNALPVLTGNITIVGNGDTLNGSNALRLFDVASGGSLSLENMTLSDGDAQYYGTPQGGAIYSSGTLTLGGVTVKSNRAQGVNGSDGGNGSSGVTGINGGNGGQGGQGGQGGSGASAYGGGLYVAGGTVTLSNDTFSDNHAAGGEGGNGGQGGQGGNGANGFNGTSAATALERSGGNGGNGGQGGQGGNGGAGGGAGVCTWRQEPSL